MTFEIAPTGNPVLPADSLAFFLATSVVLTGFERFDLLGTGLLQQYFDYVSTHADSSTLLKLLQGVTAAAGSESAVNEILADPEMGLLARQIIKLWYTGQWFPSATATDNPILSPSSYEQGLVWNAIEAHPPGAKQQGFGAWSEPFTPLVSLTGDASSKGRNA